MNEPESAMGAGGGVGPLHEAASREARESAYASVAHQSAVRDCLHARECGTYEEATALIEGALVALVNSVADASVAAVLRVVGTQLHAAIVAEFAIEHALARQGVPQHPVTAATCNASLEAERRVLVVVAALLEHPE